ncbi:hypothetical protein LTT66_32730 [Nocardia gipuzkoensis]|uniref:hypothetical protein n=1 Tax=Nocardia gipuzkoensis TaxID=2749991 RepID=UPI001E3FD358|nr:hypothetical protein [Nocardia gipuzkoensis]UGT72469.1 hypothetical protein LTT66_32730 [Nocardia gipuzkoensis]
MLSKSAVICVVSRHASFAALGSREQLPTVSAVALIASALTGQNSVAELNFGTGTPHFLLDAPPFVG